MATYKYFANCGGEQVELLDVHYNPQQFFGVISGNLRWLKKKPYRMAGRCEKCGWLHVAQREIEWKKDPSLHRCDGRCMSAKGFSCECSCGGKNHGAAWCGGPSAFRTEAA